MNDGGGNGGSCCGINVRTDITKLSNNTIIARFGDGRNCIGKCKVLINGEAKIANRVGGIK